MNEEDQTPVPFNQQLAARRGDMVLVMMPKGRMTRSEALEHAAWLVAVAEDGDPSVFAAMLERVRNT